MVKNENKSLALKPRPPPHPLWLVEASLPRRNQSHALGQSVGMTGCGILVSLVAPPLASAEGGVLFVIYHDFTTILPRAGGCPVMANRAFSHRLAPKPLPEINVLIKKNRNTVRLLECAPYICVSCLWHVD